MGHRNVAMGVISCSDEYNLMEEIIINAYFPKIGILTKRITTWLLKTSLYFVYYTNRAIYPCYKLNFHEISQMIPFPIAGLIMCDVHYM